MARAEAKETTPTEDAISNAGDAMMLLISRSVWEVLQLQSRGEEATPGAVLSVALSEYVEKHGTAEAKLYMRQLEEHNRRIGGRRAAG